MKEYLIIENDVNSLSLKENFDFENDSDEIGFESVLNIINNKYCLSMLESERLYLLGFDFLNKPIGTILISAGDYEGTYLYKRNIALGTLLMGAKKIIIIHNHPGDNCEISENDHEASDRIKEVADLIGVKYEGSIIFCRSGWIDLDDEVLHEWRY